MNRIRPLIVLAATAALVLTVVEAASPARGRVRAKTGTLAAVTTLAGYVGVDSARPIAFAIFVNDIPTGQKGPARAMADDMLDAIVAYLEAEAAR